MLALLFFFILLMSVSLLRGLVVAPARRCWRIHEPDLAGAPAEEIATALKTVNSATFNINLACAESSSFS